MLWMLLLLFAVVPAFAGQSQSKDAGKDEKSNKAAETATTASEQVYDLGEGIKPPRLIHQVNPDYSGVRGVRVKGSIAIAITVTSQGAAKDPQVVQGLQPQVDRCAVEAVKQWRFAPAQKDGKPVAVHVTIELDFHSM